MPKLSETIGRVSREVPMESKIMTLFGKETYLKFRCKTCHGMFLYSEAYMNSASRRRNGSDIREYCAPCWSKHNGKTYESLHKDTSVTTTLFDVFGMCE